MEAAVKKMPAKNVESVWLLMGKEYRISRSIHLQWFFQHLNTVVAPKSDEEIVNSTEELEVLSLLPTNKDSDSDLCIIPTTKLSFVGRQYRFVFCIDLSPSLATVDTESGNVLIDDMFDNIKNTLVGLVQPFCIPGSSLILKPRLHVTVLAHTYIHIKECQVLVQGYCVNEENVNYFLCQLKRKLQILEKSISDDISKRNRKNLDCEGETHSLKRSETSLFYMIRDGLFALELLPDNASAGIIVVTDGVFILDSALIADALLAQVRASTAVCSFLQVGTGYRRASVEFGYVPHCALMQFIATATSGAYLVQSPPVKTSSDCAMNMYHNALFCWNFRRDIDRDKIDSYQDSQEIGMLSTWADYSMCLTPSQKDVSVALPPQPQQTMRCMEFDLQTKISSVLTVRSREGYITDGIRITKDKTQIEVKLVWPWKEHVTIEYIAKAPWPFESSSYQTHVVVNVSGPYEFLVDITNTKPRNHKSLRKTVLQRFDQTMKSLEFSDQLLVQLQLFSIHPTASQIPDTAAKGSPLFFMPQNSNNPILALQYGSKTKKSSKSPEIQFANFWKLVVTMDTRTWSKWLHCHRISVLPEHDRPVIKDLFVPSSTDHYAPVHCRAAISVFNRLLKEWCSFILLENHSYIKFLTSNDSDSRSQNQKPYSFCLLRLILRGLCIVIRLAFLAGTPGEQRFQIVEDLKEQLAHLSAPIYKIKDSPSKQSKDMPCLIFLTKQFERILVKYDSIPDDVKSCGLLQASTMDMSENITSQDQQRTPGSVRAQYLFNQRWVWSVGSKHSLTIDANNIAQMLEAISKRRLHEGFHFCSSSKGIITMVKEVPVVVDSSEDNMSNCCVIQYVIFPPHNQATMKHILQDNSIESDGMHEVEGDMQMVVEVWVEPQVGTMDIANCPLDYIHGVEYNRIPAKMFEVDAQIVTEISSYVLMHASCQRDVLADNFSIDELLRPVIPTSIFQSSSIVHIPFLFDVVSLLHKSRLIVSMYPMMKDVAQDNLPDDCSNPNDVLLAYLSSTLQNMMDSKIPLNQIENKHLCEYIKERCTKNNMRIWNSETNAPIIRKHLDVDINLHCYLKSFGSCIMILLLPATVNDLCLLIEQDGSDFSIGCSRNAENDNKNESCVYGRSDLPFFIFECDYRIIKSVPPVFAPNDEDVLQDYTQALTENPLTPRHINQKLPENCSKEIAMFCLVLYDHYLWALVSGVYNCLRSGYVLDTEDVELSIELVCEESTHEIDVTNFIRTICSHYRHNAVSMLPCDDMVFSDPASSGHILNKTLFRFKKRSSSGSGSSSFRSSKTSLKFPPRECENTSLQKEIQVQFMTILTGYFQMVPNDPYFMFYIGDDNEEDNEYIVQEMGSVRSSISMSEPDFDDANSMSTSGPESDIQVDDVESISPDATAEEDINKLCPMFLHLTCSCHFKSDVRNTPVKNLPTCLAEILNGLEDGGKGIDPYSQNLSITLDLICLTQPSEPEEGDEWKTPKEILTRQDSSESFYSLQSQNSEMQKRPCLMTELSKDESSYMKTDVSSTLAVLPLQQKQAMEKTIQDIKWLLKDEIASALRTQGPVTEQNLDRVSQHVQNSTGAENCVCEQGHFMFVTGIMAGSDLSLPLFICELESATLDRYRLKKVGKYYCVVVKPDIVDDESDMKSMQVDDVKQAKINHKGLGHRRSQSDFTNNRKRTNEIIENENSSMLASKSHSVPSVYLADDFYFGSSEGSSISCINEPLTVGKPPMGSLWKNSENASSSLKKDSLSKPDSLLSLNEQDEVKYIKRSMSYCGEQGEKICERRRFSLPNIYFPGAYEESSTDVDGQKGQQLEQDFEDIIPIDPLLDVKDKAISEVADDDEDILQPHPDFWLFMNISEESFVVYLHRRRSELLRNIEHHHNIYDRLLEVINQICKIVNQRILLEHLYNANICHNLLIAEDEERLWDPPDMTSGSEIAFIKEKESFATPFGSVIHCEYQFQPGYFECGMVWQKNIPIHSRLRTSTMLRGVSKGLLATKSVLNKFRVGNRQNMFVIKESDSTVFYFRVNEGGSESDYQLSSNISPPTDDEHVFAPVKEDFQSRASSLTSLINKPDEGSNRFGRFEFERQESYQSGQFPLKNLEERSSISEMSIQHLKGQDYIQLCVYGIREPGDEIKVDMVKLISKKLEITALDLINQSLARNPKCKLTPQDVEFIQPPGQLPTRKLHLCVSNTAVRYLHAVVFFLHQHLLQKYHTPRFTACEADYHFKNYTSQKSSRLGADPISSNDMYLYIRREKAGNGIGIIFITLVDQDGNPAVAQPYYPTINYLPSPLEEQKKHLDEILQLQDVDLIPSDDTIMCKNLHIQFNIWERGDINTAQLEADLISSTKNALCDVILEYHLLSTPLCFVPKVLQKSVQSSRRESMSHRSSFSHIRQNNTSSGSSAATTPKLFKPNPLLKKFSSEPTTPNDLCSDSPNVEGGKPIKTKDDLSLISEHLDSPQSFLSDYASSAEVNSKDVEKRRNVLAETRVSPVQVTKLTPRENSPLVRKRSGSSRSSSIRSENELQVPLARTEERKNLTMNELNHMKLPVAASYVMLTDAEVHESLRAVGESENDKKTGCTWQELEIQRRLELDNQKERRKHEHGVMGDLHSNYFDCAPEIFDEIIKQGNRSTHKQEGLLTNQYVVESVMKEFVKEMSDKSPDMLPKIYRCVKRSVDGVDVTSYPKYSERVAVKSDEPDESSMDSVNTKMSIIPGQCSKFIVIGHNAHKWLLSMGTNENELLDDEEGKSIQEEQCKQLFKPLIPNLSNSQEKRKLADLQAPSCISYNFVPRQKFFMAVFNSKKITLYTYNYSMEVTAALDRQLKRLYAWNNVRTHLNSCIFIQKLGLFHHTHFVQDCAEKEDPDVACFASSSKRLHLVPLMKEVSPKSKERKDRLKLDNNHAAPPRVKVPEFDDVFRDTAPSKCLHHSNYQSVNDLVRKQGYQYQDVRNIKLHAAYQQARLKEIYDGWKQEGAHVPVTEDRLHLLKRHSRLYHYCNAPVMFKIYDDDNKEPHAEEDNILNHAADTSNDPSSSCDSDSSRLQSLGKVDWYEELKWTLVQQYIQYLQTLGLCIIQVGNKNATRTQPNKTGSLRNSRTSHRSSDGKDIILPEERPAVYHLQKTSVGGVILMEVFLKEDYLCYNMMIFETISLSEIGCYVSPKDQRMFYEDCGKFKDLTHLRSFTYDFHIRHIQLHLSGRHSIFHKGYPVHRLMEIIIQEYPKAPSFCRCILADGAVSLPCTSKILPSTVFAYLTSNASRYKLSKICVSIANSDHALLTYSYNTEKHPIQFAESWRTRRDTTEYDGNVALHYKVADNDDVLTLPYFVILANKKEFYPRPHLLTSVSSLRRRQRTTSGIETAMPENEYSVKQKNRVHFSGPNEIQEKVPVHQVSSTGSIKRMTSWSQMLNEQAQTRTSVNSVLSSGSDTALSSLSRNIILTKLSPGRSSLLQDHSGCPDSDVSTTEITMSRNFSSVSLTQESFLMNEQKFIRREIQCVGNKLCKKISRCLSNCWRDLVWNELLMCDSTTDDENKKTKKKMPTQAYELNTSFHKSIADWEIDNSLHLIPYMCCLNISFDSIRMLVELVSRYDVSDMDNRISDSYVYIQPGLQQQLIKTLKAKYSAFCRLFLSDDGESTYLCILNPGNLDMFFLVETNEAHGSMRFSAIYRLQPRLTPLECKIEDTLQQREKNSRNHIENVVTCLCFNLWLQLLPS